MSRSRLTSGTIFLQRVNDKKLSQARELRRSSTPAENKLWQYLRRNLISGYKIRRQQVIEGFIVDFFCHQAKLVIEIDGNIHETDEQQKIDTHRRAVFEARGLKEIRFRNEVVMNSIDDVIQRIITVVSERVETS